MFKTANKSCSKKLMENAAAAMSWLQQYSINQKDVYHVSNKNVT